MRAFIDANLLIYLNTLADRNLRIIYEDLYTKMILEHRLYTDVLVIDEVIYVSQKRYNLPYKVTLKFIEELVTPFVNILSIGEEEYNIAAKLIGEKNIAPSDAIQLSVMKNNNMITIVSEDSGFDKIDWIKRIWLAK